LACISRGDKKSSWGKNLFCKKGFSPKPPFQKAFNYMWLADKLGAKKSYFWFKFKVFLALPFFQKR